MPLARRTWITLGAIALVVVLVLAMLLSRPGAEGADPAGDPAAGSSGLGDPYLPEAGGGGYDVQDYDVAIRVSGANQDLQGRATLTARALQDLDRLHLDLYLGALAVSVNDRPASFEQQGDDLAVIVDRTQPDVPAIRAGATFTVTVDYAGRPGEDGPAEPSPHYTAGDEFVIVGEPVSASLWFPSNDHPRDPATMTFSVTVPRGVEAICAGLLVGNDPDPDDPASDRWVWRLDTPTVTYATFLAVGQYRVERGTAGERPFVYAVSTRLSRGDQERALKWLAGTPAAVAKLETYLGPYPFKGLGGIVPGTQFRWGGIEAAMRPVYHNGMIGSQWLLNHELAHMWFGNTVTLTEWNDMFNNESLTSYFEWLTSGDSTPGRLFDRLYWGRATDRAFWGPALSDVGLDRLFERVYDRGPLVVHALRTRMGDTEFFAFIKTWAQQSGPRSLEDFRRAADDATAEDLTDFFAEWLDQTDRPEPTAANGVPGR